MPFARLTRADFIQVLALASRSRKAVKRFLHDRDLPAGSSAVDEVLALIARRPDADALRAEAQKIQPPATPEFSLVEQLARILADRGFAGDQAVTVLARHAHVDRELVQRFLAGDDIPLATLDALFRAAGAVRVQFRDPSQTP